MKHQLLLVLSAMLLLSSCEQYTQCVPPPCSRPELNEVLSIELDFCQNTNTNTNSCFSNEDLAQVSVVSKFNHDQSIVAIDTVYHLANFNNIITLGKYGIPLTSNAFNQNLIDLNFELVVINTGHRFTITDIELIDIHRDNSCECPKYEIVQLKLNDEWMDLRSALVRLPLGK